MDSDHQLIAAWVKWVAIVLVSIIALSMGSCQMTKYRIAEAIKAGADPMRARCALETNPSQFCLIQYAEKPTDEKEPKP